MPRLQEAIYRWFRFHTPTSLRRALKRFPGIRRWGQESRPRGDQWLSVELAPGLKRRMLLSEAAHSISYDGHEPEARAWISANVKPGFVCLDVGAHLGVFTLLMGELAGPSGAVHAFEPFSASVDMTRRTLDENRLSDRVKLVQAAVDEEDGGNVRLFVSESSPSEASLHDGETRPGSVDVPRVSLDAYVQREGLEQVDVIKMDIEGTEERALRGARQILEHMTPRLLVEIHGRQNIGALDLLVSLGYSVTTVSGAPISSATFPEAGVHVVATHGT